jgi:hypothetical protein
MLLPRWLSFRTFIGAGLCAGSLLGSPGDARAAEPSAADRATARALAQEGYAALREQQFATAVDRFARADALVHAPTLLRDLARAQIGLGHLVDAQQTYRKIINEGVARRAPASWARAVEDAKLELAALEPRLPWLTITVEGPARPQVTLDGAAVEDSSLGVKRAADPGRHELRAQAAGYQPADKSIVLKEGETANVSFKLEESPREAPPKPEPVVTRVSVPEPKEPGWRKPATVSAFALGGAGILVGSVTGILAISKHKQLTKDCPSGTCGPDQQSSLDDFHTLSTVSTIGFVAGGIGLGTGVVLLLVKPKPSVEHEPPPTAGRAGARSRLSVSAFVGIHAAGVEGTF